MELRRQEPHEVGMLVEEVSDPPRNGEQMGNAGAGDEDFLIDVFCQELFEVEERLTSQISNKLKATFPTSCRRQIASFPALEAVSCFWENAVSPWSFLQMWLK